MCYCRSDSDAYYWWRSWGSHKMKNSNFHLPIITVVNKILYTKQDFDAFEHLILESSARKYEWFYLQLPNHSISSSLEKWEMVSFNQPNPMYIKMLDRVILDHSHPFSWKRIIIIYSSCSILTDFTAYQNGVMILCERRWLNHP